MNCKYFDICGLPAYPDLDNLHCYLHSPIPSKRPDLFTKFLKDHLNSGKSDISHFYFHRDDDGIFTRRVFSSTFVAKNVHWVGNVNLSGSTFQAGLDIAADDLAILNLSGGTIQGNVTIAVKKSIENLVIQKTSVSGRLHVSAMRLRNLDFHGEAQGGNLTINCTEDIGTVVLHERTLDGLRIAARLIDTLNVANATLNGTCDVSVTRIGNYVANRATINGAMSIIVAERANSMTFNNAEINGTLMLRGEIDNVNFDAVEFSSTTKLNFDTCHFRGRLQISARDKAPDEISIDGAEFDGPVEFKADMGLERIHILAKTKRPRFGTDVTLSNVDLAECRLVGNALSKINFVNIAWAKTEWAKRNVLYDELVRSKYGIPLEDIREACQFLKQMYQGFGDHATSGDFHYTELETKRLSYGRVKQVLHPEWWYWVTSGYGIGYRRAFLLLLGILLFFTMAYRFFNAEAFSFSFWQALRHSIEVATLQRPAIPKHANDITRWLMTFELVLAPLQAAFFALALRMRLKR
jgi:uncharacterized protein YjbI with pentapeptide repeats